MRSPLRRALDRRFARLVTRAVLWRPELWRLLRAPLERQFDRLAPSWDGTITPDHLNAWYAALDSLDRSPRRALDVGSGTGVGAFALADRFPEAEVVGVDVAARMVGEARSKTPPELGSRVSFVQADAAGLPFESGSFDLVSHINAIPFFDELARVVSPAGAVVFGFSGGPGTPIYVPPERLRAELGRRGFTEFAEFSAGRGSAVLARKAGSS